MQLVIVHIFSISIYSDIGGGEELLPFFRTITNADLGIFQKFFLDVSNQRLVDGVFVQFLHEVVLLMIKT